jgi:hypothetical protein
MLEEYFQPAERLFIPLAYYLRAFCQLKTYLILRLGIGEGLATPLICCELRII